MLVAQANGWNALVAYVLRYDFDDPEFERRAFEGGRAIARGAGKRLTSGLTESQFEHEFWPLLVEARAALREARGQRGDSA